LVFGKFVDCVFVCILVWSYRYYKFSDVSYLFIAAFMMLHTVGAHYSYETPFNHFLNDFFGNGRDNFDRVVHFSFGLLIAYPGFEFMRRVIRVRSIWTYFLTPLVTMTFTAVVSGNLTKKGNVDSNASTYQTSN
jgi:putative membrane protein